MDIPVYVICLQKTRKSRCDPTYHAWKNVMRNTQRLVAVTPSDFELEKVTHPYALSCIRNKERKTLEFIGSDKEVACAMSHIKAWKTIAESNQPGIVVEDDMAMSQCKIEKMVYQLTRMPQDTEVYLLHFIGINLQSTPLTRGYIDVKQFTGLQAYYLTPQASRKLLKNAFPIIMQVDSYVSKAGLKVRSRRENKMPWIKFMKDNLASTLGKNHVSSTMFVMLVVMVVVIIVLIVVICIWTSREQAQHHHIHELEVLAARKPRLKQPKANKKKGK